MDPDLDSQHCLKVSRRIAFGRFIAVPCARFLVLIKRQIKKELSKSHQLSSTSTYLPVVDARNASRCQQSCTETDRRPQKNEIRIIYKFIQKGSKKRNFEKPFLGRLAQVADCSRISNLLDERHLDLQVILVVRCEELHAVCSGGPLLLHGSGTPGVIQP
jgi:hypothetical protein